MNIQYAQSNIVFIIWTVWVRIEYVLVLCTVHYVQLALRTLIPVILCLKKDTRCYVVEYVLISKSKLNEGWAARRNISLEHTRTLSVGSWLCLGPNERAIKESGVRCRMSASGERRKPSGARRPREWKRVKLRFSSVDCSANITRSNESCLQTNTLHTFQMSLWSYECVIYCTRNCIIYNVSLWMEI